MRRSYLSLLVFIILSLIWSSTWLFIKLGLETMPPFYAAAWRFLIAFLILYLYGRKKHLPIPQDIKSHLFFIVFGMSIFTVSYGLVYWGEQYINSGLTSVLFSVMPFYTALIALKILPDEKMNSHKLFGLLLGFAGIVIIFYDQLTFSTSTIVLLAMGAILLSPLFSAYGTLISKKAAHTYHPVTMNTLPLLYASISFFVLHFFLEKAPASGISGMALISLFYLGIFGTAIAFVLYVWMLQHTSALLMSSITFVTPPMALMWGWVILDEPVTINLALGMVLVFSGIYLVRKE